MFDITPEGLAERAKVVEDARKRYEQNKANEDQARRDVTSALNALNAAQKEFDEALASFKSASPADSDWRRRDQRTTERA